MSLGRSKPTVGIDRSKPFNPDDYPRDPSAYRATTHFGQRFREDERFLTDEVIRKAITEGELRNNGDGCGCFVQPWGSGVKYYLLVGHHLSGYRIAVTAWPYVHDRRKAMNCPLWSTKQIDVIERFNNEAKSRRDTLRSYTNWLKQHD
jgi:hypothetical protein